MIVKPVGRWALLALLARGAFGQLGAADQVENFSFRRLTVYARTLGARTIKVATDGEVLWMPLPLRFQVAPHPLMLIRPAGIAQERLEVQAAMPEAAA